MPKRNNNNQVPLSVECGHFKGKYELPKEVENTTEVTKTSLEQY